LALAGVDEDEDGLDKFSGSVWAAADLAEDLPGFELRGKESAVAMRKRWQRPGRSRIRTTTQLAFRTA
jgi:hypothetical protein